MPRRASNRGLALPPAVLIHPMAGRSAQMTGHPREADSQLTVTRDTTASRAQVWDVIADGWTYSQWVVGNSRMRAVSADWPSAGAVIHHSIGVWPLLLDDETVVEDCVPLERLVLLAKGRPVGKARITMRLFDIEGGGCRIEMAAPRNRECTWRLAAIAERRIGDDAQ